MNSSIVIKLVITLFASLIIGGAFWLAIKYGEPKIYSSAELYDETDYYTGDAQAKIWIVEFSDFQCPFCAITAKTLEQIESKYGQQVKIVFKHFPLESIHDNAQLAAQAAEAAGAQGKFWQMAEILFNNQEEWETLSTEEAKLKFKEYVQSIGVEDLKKFQQELDNANYQTEVQKDIDKGNTLGVDSTPTLFLNGQRVSSRKMSYSSLEEQIDKLISKSQ